MQLSFLQKTLSFIAPVRVFVTSSPQHKCLELYRYRGRWQLATEDAFYSDGAAYSPLRKAFKALSKEVLLWKSVLVLGAGIGSAVMVLDKKHKRRPQITLVDMDEEILSLAGQILYAEGYSSHVELVCEDAAQYVILEEKTFDALIIDIFRGREVPQFALQESFLKQSLLRLNPGGWFILNFIVNNPLEWERLEETLTVVIPHYKTLAHGVNRILLWQKPQE